MKLTGLLLLLSAVFGLAQCSLATHYNSTASSVSVSVQALSIWTAGATLSATEPARADQTLTRLRAHHRRGTQDSEQSSMMSQLSDLMSRTSGYTTLPGFLSMRADHATLLRSLRNFTDMTAPAGATSDLISFWQSAYQSRLDEFSRTQTYLPQDVVSSMAEDRKLFSYLSSKLQEMSATATATDTAKGKTKTVVLTKTAVATATADTSQGYHRERRDSRSAAMLGGFLAAVLIGLWIL